MATFDKIISGIPGLDAALNNIRLGDTIAIRVSDLSEFRVFINPFVAQAITDHRILIYFRFANHDPLVADIQGAKIYSIPLSYQFETFTVKIHDIIEREGRNAFYVFDCLSELQVAWATDLMMGNFYKVICPCLSRMDAVSFFPIVRGKHSVSAISKIKESSKLFLDVYSDARNMFIRPAKVWNRSSETMFLPHVFYPENGDVKPILDAVLSSRFYQAVRKHSRFGEEQYIDSWDRFFDKAKERYAAGENVEKHCDQMCKVMMTRDEKLRALVKKHFTPEDYFDARNHMIGTGMIGGKACGMLLARAILRNSDPKFNEVLEAHDSFFVGSDLFYTYIVDNDFWDTRLKQRTENGYFTLAQELSEKFMSGVFSEEMETHFINILEYYGQDPFIVRSSSILEDGFGNAFAGKYESVFCVNRGDLKDRLAEFENAIKTVYASTMSLSALDYRKRRGLDKKDEQMSLLIQRVSGSYYGPYFMPCAAGVGYSYSPYKFLRNIDQHSGMLRLVMGLGTSAVDRIEGSYPRLVSLDRPHVSQYTTDKEKHRFSQRKVEVIDSSGRCLKRLSCEDLIKLLPPYVLKNLTEHDYEAEDRLRELGHRREVLFVSCQGLANNIALMSMMQNMLALISAEYGQAVDIEYTINLSSTGEYAINLLQCRPLLLLAESGSIHFPESIEKDDIILENYHASMGLTREERIDLLVYVDPICYYELPQLKKPAVAKLIGKINWEYRNSGKKMILLTPGRIGTSSPELGIPTAFSDISEFTAVIELEETQAGYNPELSYGSHIFQDLVEQNILYSAIFKSSTSTIFAPEQFSSLNNKVSSYDPSNELGSAVRIIDTSEKNCRLYYDAKEEHLLICYSR